MGNTAKKAKREKRIKKEKGMQQQEKHVMAIVDGSMIFSPTSCAFVTETEALKKGYIYVGDDDDEIIKTFYCVELDQVFNDLYQAAEQFGVNAFNIVQCCKGKKKTAGGYTWKYAK